MSFLCILLHVSNAFLLFSLPLSPPICPLLIISHFPFLFISFSSTVYPWLSGVAVGALWWLPPASGSEWTIWLLSACLLVSLCARWSVMKMWGDEDVIEIKDCGWVRFKPIYYRSIHSSRSRGKTCPPVGLTLVHSHLIIQHMGMSDKCWHGDTCIHIIHTLQSIACFMR